MPPADKTKVLIIGCGDLGGAVAAQLAMLNLEVIGVRRHIGSLNNVTMVQADVTRQDSLSSLNNIQPDILIYSVAADGQTDAQYKAQYVEGLRHALNTQLRNSNLKHVFFISSTRVYGKFKETDDFLTESDIPFPNDFGGERLLEAENLLKPFVRQLNQVCAYTVLRLTGIYGVGRWRMFDLAKRPESWPKENRWTNRIHRDDAAAFIVHLVQKILTGNSVKNCYIVTDSSPSMQYDVLRWISVKMQIAYSLDVKSPLATSRRFSNQAMLETGFKLRYQDYQSGYQSLLPEYLKTQNNIEPA